MLEKQVTNLELSKKLDELGIKKPSIFVWDVLSDTAYAVQYFPYATYLGCNFRAYLATELLEILPQEIKFNDKYCYLQTHKEAGYWYVLYKNIPMFVYPIKCESETLADACAEILIYLIENNLWSPEDDKK